MNKKEVYDYLNKKNIKYEVIEHEAVRTMEESTKIGVLYPDGDAKNLFVRDDKKRNYYLITVKGDPRVDLKEFKNKHNTRTLSFASEKDLWDKMKLIPGSVTPLGLVNDNDKKIIFFLDKAFFNGSNMIAVHPNENTATVWLNVNDLVEIIKEHGNQINIVDI